ncbi:MAG: hypothetical protein JRJ85_22290 [Deltaproteobacteria bacterium]|nr:hypothetical protein [Deltaproteobacteria bacterium]
MKKEKQHHRLFRTQFATLVFIFATIFMIAPSHAAGPVIASMNEAMVHEVIIDNMAPDFNYVFIGERRLRVSPGAAIKDHNGKSIPLRLLPVPCRARMTYRIFGDHRDPLVLKIRLR